MLTSTGGRQCSGLCALQAQGLAVAEANGVRLGGGGEGAYARSVRLSHVPGWALLPLQLAWLLLSDMQSPTAGDLQGVHRQ